MTKSVLKLSFFPDKDLSLKMTDQLGFHRHMSAKLDSAEELFALFNDEEKLKGSLIFSKTHKKCLFHLELNFTFIIPKAIFH